VGIDNEDRQSTDPYSTAKVWAMFPNAKIVHLRGDRELKHENIIKETHIHWPGKTEMLRKLKFLHIKVSDSTIIIWCCEMNSTTTNQETGILITVPISIIKNIKIIEEKEN